RGENSPVYQACAGLLRWSATFLALSATTGVALSALVLHSSAEDFTWADALNTTFSLSGLLIAVIAIAIACLARRPQSRERLVLTGLVFASALMSSHAFARIDGRFTLLLVTASHHLAVAAWIGGLPYLLTALIRSGDDLGTQVARRFSRLAMASVAVLC